MTMLRWYGDDAKRKMASAIEHAVHDTTEVLLEESNRTVPIEEATLQRSGTAEVDGHVGRVSYDTPYAARQHEDMALTHDAGRRAKWLEATFRERASSLGSYIASVIKRAF